MIILIFILVVGLVIMFKTRFIMYKDMPNSLGYLKKKEKGISFLSGLFTSLAAALGVGNILGVTQALILGGIGSIFWMWLSSIIGCATKYAEAYLSTLYKEKKDDEYVSGPMYFIKNGLDNKYMILAYLYAFFGVIASLGIGNMIQANAINKALKFNSIILGVVLVIIVYLTIRYGIKVISKINNMLVPFIIVLFLSCSIIILVKNYKVIDDIFILIMKEACSYKAFLGGNLYVMIKYGISRGLLSNEAGLGSSGIIYGCVEEDPHEVGVIAALDPIIDTIILCSLTFVIIIIDNNYLGMNINNDYHVVYNAFKNQIGFYGGITIFLSVIILGFLTIISWYYYGLCCYRFLFKNQKVYLSLYLLFIFLGVLYKSEGIYQFCEIANMLMAIPNLIGILLLIKKL